MSARLLSDLPQRSMPMVPGPRSYII